MSGRSGLRVRGDLKTGWEGSGGYMEAKVQKLEEQFEHDSEGREQLSDIFRGIAIQVNGYTNPSADELKMIMSRHGGKFHMYYSRIKTTHVIASNLPRAKRKELRPNQKVVKPEWIVDSLKAHELLPFEPYLVVPLDNGSQSRISNLLGKRQSIESDSASTSSLPSAVTQSSASSLTVNSEKSQHSADSIEPSEKSVNTSSICPTADSNFLSEFYSHSRLHFLSTWKMELTEYVRSLQSGESLKEVPLSGYQQLMEIAKSEGCQSHASSNPGRAVMHIDMDCFFVSVGLISRPELQGLPVAVTHSSGAANVRERSETDVDYEIQFYKSKLKKTSASKDGETSKEKSSSSLSGLSTSEIASCSYEARKAGIKNGMFFGKAKQMCPELRAIPYDFEAYRKASQQLYSTVASYTRHIEAVSCDEVLVDITKLVCDSGLDPLKVASVIRDSVKKATSCNASAGVGPNIALARMATKRAKPDGHFAVTEKEAKDFIKLLSVKDLPGVGRSTASRLQELGLQTCGDLQNYPASKLKQEFGVKTGQKLHDMSCGIDHREVQNEKERKSVSADVNYGIRLSSEEEARTFLQNLSKEVSNRLKSINMRGQKVTLKVMARRADAPQESAKYGGHGVCDTSSRSAPLSGPDLQGPLCEANDTKVIFEAAWSMLKSLKVKVEDLRGIGLQITQLKPAESSSKSAESSSAAFLKKFVVKKSEIVPSEPAPSTTDTITNTPPIESSPSKSTDPLNSSFLDALPPDLRAEVEATISQQKEALKRNFKSEPEPTDKQQTNVPRSKEGRTQPSSSVPNVLFCGRGKLGGGASGAPSMKPSRGRGRGKRGASSMQVRNQKSAKSSIRKVQVISNTSPNKLITDMFPVTYSPRKTSPLIKTGSPKKMLLATSAVQKVKKNLLSLVQEDQIVIPDSDEDERETALTEDKAEEDKEPTESNQTPSLGGARSIQEVRQVLGEWIEAYSVEEPLDCDVDDFINFLCKTASELRDLEKVHLVLRSFRRKLLELSEKPDVEVFHHWVSAYDRVCFELQICIRKAYGGSQLDILPIFLEINHKI